MVDRKGRRPPTVEVVRRPAPVTGPVVSRAGGSRVGHAAARGRAVLSRAWRREHPDAGAPELGRAASTAPAAPLRRRPGPPAVPRPHHPAHARGHHRARRARAGSGPHRQGRARGEDAGPDLAEAPRRGGPAVRPGVHAHGAARRARPCRGVRAAPVGADARAVPGAPGADPRQGDGQGRPERGRRGPGGRLARGGGRGQGAARVRAGRPDAPRRPPGVTSGGLRARALRPGGKAGRLCDGPADDLGRAAPPAASGTRAWHRSRCRWRASRIGGLTPIPGPSSPPWASGFAWRCGTGSRSRSRSSPSARTTCSSGARAPSCSSRCTPSSPGRRWPMRPHPPPEPVVTSASPPSPREPRCLSPSPWSSR